MSKKRALPEYVYEIPRYSGRIYFQRFEGSKRHRIREKLYSPEFWSIYAAWIKAYAALQPDMPVIVNEHASLCSPDREQKSPSRLPATPNTWRWVCQRFFAAPTYKSLAPSSRRAMRRVLEKTWPEPIHPETPHLTFGDMPLAKLRAKQIKVLRDRKSWIEDEEDEQGEVVEIRQNPEAANSRVKYIRTVLTWVKEEPELADLIEHRNWARDVDYFPPRSSSGHPTWSLDEIEQFRRYWPIGTKARLAMEILLLTLQRRGDVVRLGRGVLKADGQGRPMLILKQEKNARHAAKAVTAYIPLFPELQEIIEATPERGDLFYLVSEHGKPFVKESFSNWFRDRCIQADIKGRSARGLRKAGIVELIRRKYTPQQIMSISGHKTMKEIDRYAREYLRQQAAEQVLDEWLKLHATAA
jgi:integrase